MLCSIFNQYHSTLHHPLQVLSIFLAEFSDFSWCDGAITIQGIVPFRTGEGNENQPWLRAPLESDIVTPAAAIKHHEFYHMLNRYISSNHFSYLIISITSDVILLPHHYIISITSPIVLLPHHRPLSFTDGHHVCLRSSIISLDHIFYHST